MTRRETVAREIELAFDFVRYAIEHTAVLDDIPDGSYIEVLSGDRPLPRTPPGTNVVHFSARRTFSVASRQQSGKKAA